MPEFNNTVNRTPKQANRKGTNAISVEAKKRCAILRKIEYTQELRALGLSADDINAIVAAS